ncbi:MAG TPA: hypothetical protein VFV63_06640 [Ilumatobacteraceae bacterium]|nr:hypothetical protein [Ilumatobacteraceae bacterium]
MARTEHSGSPADPLVRARVLPAASAALALCLVVSLAAGCSIEESSPSTTPVPAPPTVFVTASGPAIDSVPPTTGVPSESSTPAVPAGTEAPPITNPPPDPLALLTAAFDAIAGGYHFATVATVNDVVAVTADGDRVGEGTRVNVTTGGSTVSYAITLEGTWVLADGSWSELDQPAPAVDPVGALRSPTSIVVSSYGAGPTVLTGTYPASVLSLAGDGPVEVALEFDGTTLRSITYASTQNGALATVRADVSPLVDATPVTLPVV